MEAANTEDENEFRIESRICDFNPLVELLSLLVAANTEDVSEFRTSPERTANVRINDIFLMEITFLVDILATIASSLPCISS